jgi:hypothetical protein
MPGVIEVWGIGRKNLWSFGNSVDVPDEYDEIAPGNQYLTRLVQRRSATVYHRMYKPSRGRFSELVGILAPRSVIESAKVEADRTQQVRAERRQKAVVRRQREHEREEQKVTEEMLQLYPSMPPAEAVEIVEHAWAIGSGRVGRTSQLATTEAIEMAVKAHIRHVYTEYDEVLQQGVDRDSARVAVKAVVWAIHDEWRRRKPVEGPPAPAPDAQGSQEMTAVPGPQGS